MRISKLLICLLFLLCYQVTAAQNSTVNPYIFAVNGYKNGSRDFTVQTGFQIKGFNGLITTLHGVAGKNRITALNENGKFFDLKVTMVDVNNDIALLAPASGYDNSIGLTLNRAAQVSPQQMLRVLGHPLGIGLIDKTVTGGRPSYQPLNTFIPPAAAAAFSARNSPFEQIQVIYIEGNLVPGHSGAPLLNGQNEVMGVVDGGLAGGAAGTSWAIPLKNINLTAASQNTAKLNALAQLHAEDLFATELSQVGTATDLEDMKYDLLRECFLYRMFNCYTGQPTANTDLERRFFPVTYKKFSAQLKAKFEADQHMAYICYSLGMLVGFTRPMHAPPFSLNAAIKGLEYASTTTLGNHQLIRYRILYQAPYDPPNHPEYDQLFGALPTPDQSNPVKVYFTVEIDPQTGEICDVSTGFL